jgi:hypothetical protein
MYNQLGLEVNSKNCEDSQIESNFNEFWSEGLHYRKWSQEKDFDVLML